MSDTYDFGAFPKQNYHILKISILRLTCRKSNVILTILGDFDWHASSNGVKYLSASTNPACFGMGNADDLSLSALKRKTYKLSNK